MLSIGTLDDRTEVTVQTKTRSEIAMLQSWNQMYAIKSKYELISHNNIDLFYFNANNLH